MAAKKDKESGRNYEYDSDYESSPEQIKRRVIRNRDRREAEKKGLVKKGDGKDIHHIDDKNMKKPVVRDASKNRADKKKR